MPVLRPIGWAVVVYLVVCLVSAVVTIGLGGPDAGALLRILWGKVKELCYKYLIPFQVRTRENAFLYN